MRLSRVRNRRRAACLAAATLVAAGVVSVVGAGAASADPVTGSDANGTYLALGDSVAFGYVPSAAQPAPNYRVAHTFVGYPEYLAQQLRERVSNASCPGETSTSMLTGSESNGCEDSVGSPAGYRTVYPLHVQYKGTQMDYALDYLARHKHTRLVTIDIGANDAFRCETLGGCTTQPELIALGGQIAANLGTIYHELRDVAHYTGQIVVLAYFYPAPGEIPLTELLNSFIEGAGVPYGVTVADGLGAFATASASSGGDPCAAGLLIKLPNGTCSVHPTAAGQQVLADAIAAVVGH